MAPYNKQTVACSLSLGLLLSGKVMGAPLPKVPVCHVTGNGAVTLLNISGNALTAHINHGDFSEVTFYRDNDEDGVGAADNTAEACSRPEGYVEPGPTSTTRTRSFKAQYQSDLAALEKDYEEVGTGSVDDESEGGEGDE